MWCTWIQLQLLAQNGMFESILSPFFLSSCAYLNEFGVICTDVHAYHCPFLAICSIFSGSPADLGSSQSEDGATGGSGICSFQVRKCESPAADSNNPQFKVSPLLSHIGSQLVFITRTNKPQNDADIFSFLCWVLHQSDLMFGRVHSQMLGTNLSLGQA